MLLPETLQWVAFGLLIASFTSLVWWRTEHRWYQRQVAEVFAMQDAHERKMERQMARVAAEHSGMTLEQWDALYHDLQGRISAMARQEREGEGEMTTPKRLADFYRWLEGQDHIAVGRSDLRDEELQRLVRDYLAGEPVTLVGVGEERP